MQRVRYLTIGEAIDKIRWKIELYGLERKPICYNVSEAVYRLCGGKRAGLKAMKIDRGNHWFLQGPYGEIIDLTAGQFTRHTYRKLPAYSRARGVAFFPNPSTLAKKLMK